MRCTPSYGRIAAMGFWVRLDALVTRSTVVVDRPKGSAHPRFASITYPLDYGYLEGTCAADRGGIDVWVGGQGQQTVSGIICTVDESKGDAEIKLLLGCTGEEAAQALAVHNRGHQGGLLVLRPDGPERTGHVSQE